MPRHLTEEELTDIPRVYGVSLRLTALVSEVRERRKRDAAIAEVVSDWRAGSQDDHATFSAMESVARTLEGS